MLPTYLYSDLPKLREHKLYAEIDTEALQAFRRKFPVERDADNFELLIEKGADR